MAFPTLNPALSPFAYLSEGCLQNVCAVLAAGLPKLDELGHALTVPLHGGFPTLITGDVNSYQVAPDYTGPFVTVRLRWGRTRFSAGPNIIAENADGSRVAWLNAQGCRILAEVTAQSEAQCHYLVDGTLGAMVAAYNLDPAGFPQESVALYALASRGVNIYGFDEIPEPRVVRDDARPLGQFYRTTIPFLANCETTWTIPATVHLSRATQTTSPVTS